MNNREITLNWSDVRLVKVEAGNPIGYAPGWYMFSEAAKRSWGPFDSPAAWSDWMQAHMVKKVVAA